MKSPNGMESSLTTISAFVSEEVRLFFKHSCASSMARESALFGVSCPDEMPMTVLSLIIIAEMDFVKMLIIVPRAIASI